MNYLFCSVTGCFGGFGTFCGSAIYGSLSYTNNAGDAEAVVTELANLLTSGRLDQQKREQLYQAFETFDNRDDAIRHMQELIILTPEFHSYGLAQTTTALRPLPSLSKKTCKPYKAVVHLMLYGGVDSFNMLVPYSDCRKGGECYFAVIGITDCTLLV